MSNSRKPKAPNNSVSFSREERIPVEKALFGNFIENSKSFTFSDEIAPRLKYPIESLKNLIETNGYASLCVNKFAESTAGKGFNEIDDEENNLFPTDPWIIENIDIDELYETSVSAKSYGEFYWDVPFLQGKPLSLYHCPVITMSRGIGKKEGQYCQYFGIKGKEQWYPALDLNKVKSGKLGTGHYIYHWKRGSETYGVPDWIAGQVELMTSKEQRRAILSFYLNNCDPDIIIAHYGIGNADPKMIDDYKKKHEQFLQGTENRGKTDHIFRNETQLLLGKAVEVIQIQKEVITAVGLNMAAQSKQDITAFFQIPSFLVGIPSKSGWSDEQQYIMQDFISNIIQSAQRRMFYKPFSKLFPNMNVQLNTIEMPKTTQEKNQDVTVDAGKKAENTAEKITDKVIEKALNMNRELRYIEKT